jgi:class 3 adenylate cyclase
VFRPADAASDSYEGGTRFLAGRIPGARLKDLPGRDRSPWIGDQQGVLRMIDSFLGDVRREHSELDRVLATILFTDIVGSTQKAAELGDSGWRELVERHQAAVRTLLERFGAERSTRRRWLLRNVRRSGARDSPRAGTCRERTRPGHPDTRRPSHRRVRAHRRQARRAHRQHRRQNCQRGAALRGSRFATAKDLVVGSGLPFGERGSHELKGVPGTWRLYAVLREGALREARQI